MGDGIDHINIYSKGETQLGRQLSNFANLAVKTVDGNFASLEGYWYWLSVDEKHPDRASLRLAAGWEAKSKGREMRGQDWGMGDQGVFRLRIMHAMLGKLVLHPTLYAQFKESTLPFRHYYVYGTKVIEPASGQWIVDTWEFARKMVKGS